MTAGSRTRRHKYGVAPKSERWSALWGCHFDSKAERRYADQLWARQQNGEISELIRQVPVVLRPGKDKSLAAFWIKMRVDFHYTEHRFFGKHVEREVWDEFKGAEMPAFRRQKRAWAKFGPGLYRITKANNGKIEPYRHKDIWPEGMHE